jgi:glutathione peroxidase
MTLPSIDLNLIDGSHANTDDYTGKVLLVVNVASKCGFTPQYEALEALYQKYGSRGLVILGVPTDQFKQELGSDEEVAEFCSLNYGVTFPLTAKTNVNGSDRHPLFAEVTKAKDGLGLGGRVMWNFEKFLILPNGQMHRFRSITKPDDKAIVSLIEANLPK